MSTTNDIQKFLLAEMAHYISGKDLSVWQLSELRQWVDSGRSVLDNPWGITGEDGGVLDYLSAKQIVDGEVEEYPKTNANSKEVEDSAERIVFVGKIKTDIFESQTLVIARNEEDARNKVLERYKPSLKGFVQESEITVLPFVAGHEPQV